MNSKEDDTLPLPGFSQEFSIDNSVDEDFIPTTQPDSSDSSKMSKNFESNCIRSAEELKSSDTNSKPSIEGMSPPESKVDETIPEEDTETKILPDYPVEEIDCKKELPVCDSEESFKDQTNASWDRDSSKISESLVLGPENSSVVNDTPTKVSFSYQKTDVKEGSITEIIVNDSAETVYLDQTPAKVEKSGREIDEEKSEVSCSLNSDVERCQETQIFDCSSVLLLDQPGSEKRESFNGFTSEKSFVQETVDDNLENVEVQNTENGSPAVDELKSSENGEVVPKKTGKVSQDKEAQHNFSEQNNAAIVVKKIDFNLTVSCYITLNVKTNNVLQKAILNVDETPKFNPKPFHFEADSDNMSDKSKRQSTSSSGSVYSDKTGLPFVLPKRVSAISDQTDSSEEEFAFFPKKERRLRERIPWRNEYLLPLKMDDIMQASLDNQELLRRANGISSPRNHKSKHDRVNHLKEILEKSDLESSQSSAIASENNLEKNETEGSTELPKNMEKPVEDVKENSQNETNSNTETVQCGDKEQPPSEENGQNQTKTEEQTTAEDKSSSLVLCKDLPVFARWTDKRYYSGVLTEKVKSDRWEVKFDDGASKAVADMYIIPAECLKVGALVFALMEDVYESGQIVDIKEGNETSYVVELDDEKKKVSTKISDLRLTNDLADIIREKYKLTSNTPRRKPELDFDNILSGKRLREQKTPLRSQVAVDGGSSKGKAKKNGGKGLDEIKETTEDDSRRELRGLKSENGHLVEDKIISADSPSGNEAVETPKGASKVQRHLAKPRSLSYDTGETRSGKKTSKSYLRSDGTPIPGTSGVKYKKQKTNSKDTPVPSNIETRSASGAKSSKTNLAQNKASRTAEKNRRKRKLEESFDDSIQNMALKEGNSKPKRKTRN